VLGAAKDLPQLVARHRVTRLVITADLKQEMREALLETASRLGVHLHLSAWTSQEQELDVQPARPALALAASLSQVSQRAATPDSEEAGLLVKPIVPEPFR
jgi:hypothetical protein